MNEVVSPSVYYERVSARIRDTHQRLLKRRKIFGLLRLATALSAIAVAWAAWPSAALASPFLLIFLFVLRADLKNRDAIIHQERLREICEAEIRCLDHQYLQREGGAAFSDEHHPFADDLDIFGHASLFQYVNRAASEQGRRLLADWMRAPAPVGTILARQEAVRELSGMSAWVQELQAHGMGARVQQSAEENTRTWIAEESRFLHHGVWNLVRFILPSLAIAWLVVYLLGKTTTPPFLTGLVFFAAIAFYISRLVFPHYRQLNTLSPQLETLAMGIDCMERGSFQHELLRDLRRRCQPGGIRASERIHGLRRILDRFDYRMNPLVYLPLNIFLLWDLQLAFQLERWKKRNQQDSGDWFRVMAEMEALTSLGTLAFNHPNWCFPSIREGEPVFDAGGLSHPLIQEGKAVANDFVTHGTAQLALVTGSNMAGKSTFLRSVGVNMVLAGMGAPVCARSCILTPRMVMSSMRIKDSLEESTSTFYAELKKLKSIIDAVNRGEPVFILLDEILRGTNSFDRQAGAMALVRQLVRQQATGIIATHDVELAALEKEYPGSLHNYHFDVRVSGTEMFFDYMLKPGICQSMNASILMRKIGIELE